MAISRAARYIQVTWILSDSIFSSMVEGTFSYIVDYSGCIRLSQIVYSSSIELITVMVIERWLLSTRYP